MKNSEKKLPIKIDLNFILFLIFFIVSILLSFKLSVQHRNPPARLDWEKQDLSYRLFLINETLKENYSLSGEKISTGDNDFFNDVFVNRSNIPVLYLKKYACSDCYIGTIKAVFTKIGHWNSFSVISHSSNISSIEEMIDDGIIPADINVLWIDKELYINSGLQSTADLLILNPDMSIRFFLSLDFLKESYFFEQYMSFLENELKQESIN